jgi:tetratricopeptide (TPR) repeat protein
MRDPARGRDSSGLGARGGVSPAPSIASFYGTQRNACNGRARSDVQILTLLAVAWAVQKGSSMNETSRVDRRSRRGTLSIGEAQTLLDSTYEALRTQQPKLALERALSALKLVSEPKQVARCHYYAASALIDLGRVVLARRHVDEGFAALGDEADCERALLLTARAKLKAEAREFEAARDSIDEAVRLRLTDPATCPIDLASTRLFAVQFEILADRAELALYRLREMMGEVGPEHPFRGQLHYWTSVAEGVRGDVDAAIAAAETLSAWAGENANAASAFDARVLLARWNKDEKECRACVEAADARYPDQPYYGAETRLALAGVLAFDKGIEALDMLDEAAPFIRKANSIWLRQAQAIVEARAAKGTVIDEGGQLRIAVDAESMPDLDVALAVFERWIKRTAVRLFGGRSKAAKALNRHPANIYPRGKRDSGEKGKKK